MSLVEKSHANAQASARAGRRKVSLENTYYIDVV